MKRWFLAVLAVLLLLAPSSLAAKPQVSMGVTYEYVSYGYEGNPNDGVLGISMPRLPNSAVEMCRFWYGLRWMV